MKKGSLSEYLELETVEFEDQYIVGGQSRSAHSWFRYCHEILSSCRRLQRLAFLAISFVTLVVFVAISSLKKEETPTAYNSLHLFEEGIHPKQGKFNYHCCSSCQPPETAFKPYENRVDRSYCENEFDRHDFIGSREDIRNSEILRCYNLTHRYCVPDIDTDFPTLNDVDKTEYITPEFPDCAYEFFEDDNGSLHSVSGTLMPESFKAKCQGLLGWRYVYYLTPENGCGADTPLRFCNCNGTIDMDLLTGDGRFNCQEFAIADLYKMMGSEDDYTLEKYCEGERQKRCP